MTIFENVAFGLRARPRRTRPSETQIRKRVHDLLELVQLDWLADRYPSQLSGGQRQRIALARALAVEPRVLLLDEPFGALDAKVRKELRRWLRQLHEEIHVTSVFVTHDQEEALEVADRIVVLDKGHIEQAGTPAQVYERPVNAFVHEFIGESVSVPIVVRNGALHFDGHPLGLDSHGRADGPANLLLRPFDVTILGNPEESAMRGTVKRVHGLGPARRVEVVVNAGDLEHLVEIDAPREQVISPGQSVGLRLNDYRVFAAQS
jgi:sulfate transport system ATP-binding protein